MEMIDALRNMLTRHEGYRRAMYLDSLGILTIGIGHNLRDKPISDAAVQQIFADDLADVMQQVTASFPWSANLDPVRQAVLIDMGFMGVSRLRGFVKMLAAMQAGRWSVAAVQLLNSVYARQVGDRAVELARMLRTGVYGGL